MFQNQGSSPLAFSLEQSRWPSIFFCISDTSNSLSDCSKNFKKCIDWKIFTQTLRYAHMAHKATKWRIIKVTTGPAMHPSRKQLVAFDEVECKPNFDLWPFRVGLPVHGYRLKKPHSCKGTKMVTPLDFCRAMSRPVNGYRLMLRHVIRHVANMWVCEQAMWAPLSDGSFFDFFPFSRGTLRYYVLSALDFGEFER